MKKLLSILMSYLGIIITAYAQNNCGCNLTIASTQTKADTAALDLPPGARVCIMAGERGPLLLRNFKGTAEKPILFINCGGKVLVRAEGAYGIKTEQCSFFRLTGTGDTAINQGITIKGGNIGLSLDKRSSDFEIDHLEVHQQGFAGIMAKTDPTCDSSTWRGHFVMQNISLHHNTVHDVGGEGFYIGNSFFAQGRQLACGTALPHEVIDLKLYCNQTNRTGCEGIQVGCATKGCEIYGNEVTNFGQKPFAQHQNNGIQLGEGTGGRLYNNTVKDGPGNGIIVLGLGDNLIYNNVIVRPGGSGIFCDSRYTTGSGFRLINNTIVAPTGDGITVYAENLSGNTVKNNLIVAPGSGQFVRRRNARVQLAETNNICETHIQNISFVQPETDFRLRHNSPAINKGCKVDTLGITTDCDNRARQQGSAVDAGAYEFWGSGGR